MPDEPTPAATLKKFRYGLSPDAQYCFHVMADKTMQEIQNAKRTMPNGVVLSPSRIESLEEVVQFVAGVLVDFPAIAALVESQAKRIEELEKEVHSLKTIDDVRPDYSSLPTHAN